MNSTNLIILAVYLGSLFGHGMMKQAEAPPAQSAQPAQTPPADQSAQPAQTPPADQSAQPAQTPPADQSAQPAQTPPADQSAQPAQTPPADQSAQPAQTPPADQSAQPAQTPPADKSAQPAQTPPADKSAQPAQTPPADKSAQPEQTPPAVRNAQAPAAMGGATVDSYVIGAADVLAITVWKEPTLSGTILVRPDGMISLSLLGDVQASGTTPAQLADQISTKLKKYVQDPNVSVVVSQIHSKVIYMLGEVTKKGPVEMTQGMTLLEAISSAGGLTDFANQRKIYILRNESGTQVRIPARYKEALKGDGTLNLALKPGDTIVVP